jgi:hypothetical protein
MGKAMDPRLKITSGWLIRIKWTRTSVVREGISTCARVGGQGLDARVLDETAPKPAKPLNHYGAE